MVEAAGVCRRARFSAPARYAASLRESPWQHRPALRDATRCRLCCNVHPAHADEPFAMNYAAREQQEEEGLIAQGAPGRAPEREQRPVLGTGTRGPQSAAAFPWPSPGQSNGVGCVN